MDASGHQVELQKDFEDACVMMRGNGALIALLSSTKGTCDVYLLKEDQAMGYSYDLDSSLHISEGNVLLCSVTDYSFFVNLTHFRFITRGAKFAHRRVSCAANETSDWLHNRKGNS